MPAMLEEKKERRKRKKEKSTAASKSVKSCEPRDEALHAQKGNPTPLPTVAPHDLCPPPEKLRRLNSSSLVIHFLLSVSRSAISYLQFYLMTPPFRRRVNNRPQQQRLRWLESPKKLTASPKIKGISVYPVLTITIAATLAIYVLQKAMLGSLTRVFNTDSTWTHVVVEGVSAIFLLWVVLKALGRYDENKRRLHRQRRIARMIARAKAEQTLC